MKPASRAKNEQKQVIIQILQWVYLGSFILIVAAGLLLHSTERPFLDVLRIPIFFRLAEPYVGFSYKTSLTTYHFAFAYFLLLIFINTICLFRCSNEFLRKLSHYSSFVGFFLIGGIILYFLYSYCLIAFSNYQATVSAFIFILLSMVFFLLNLITFFVDKRGIYHTH
ncbi:MAG: hypothetical protein A2Y57_01435 [Candidatus Woykebacteria bacterium RBG_13_40_7b]|uniref:Uncharacterized protein n=1 Tax=Candidatus Woykebacteria bacterium RBG_13_40_7b TaxID=1802594 RepID=A0A1G1W5W5_9BACT|nr:MAG: hypothetical protein A2Y57_01435 [Candidatus Woykebacteria bacterium RBG_13_40_7b]